MQKEIKQFGDGQASLGVCRRSEPQDAHSGQPVEAALFIARLNLRTCGLSVRRAQRRAKLRSVVAQEGLPTNQGGGKSRLGSWRTIAEGV